MEETEIGCSVEHQRPVAADRELVVLDYHAGRPRDLGGLDLGPQGARPRANQGVLASGPSQVAELERLAAGQGRAHVGRYPAARLERRLQQDCVRNALLTICLEVPGIARDVVFRLGRGSRGHGPGLAFQADNPVQELVGRSGKPGDEPAVVELAVAIAKSLRGLARRERQYLLLAVEDPRPALFGARIAG